MKTFDVTLNGRELGEFVTTNRIAAACEAMRNEGLIDADVIVVKNLDSEVTFYGCELRLGHFLYESKHTEEI